MKTDLTETQLKDLIDTLAQEHRLSWEGYRALLAGQTPELSEYAARLAVGQRKEIFGTAIYTRGLIEFTNYCKNDCLYCGIRCGNRECQRYRLSTEDILACADAGYSLGFRTFVLQGGEDPHYTDDVLCGIVSQLKQTHPDCAVTLSVGERSRESYQRLFDAGAERFLLRHETADRGHYAYLHPAQASFENRMDCLRDLKDIGYAAGCGFMVGSPGQTPRCLASDLAFIQEFQPEMCGIGPFIPHKETPFANEPRGSLEQTFFCLSLIRLIKPDVLLPATTALATIDERGRELGIEAGANVLMPNLTPASVRGKYTLYDNKACWGDEDAGHRSSLQARMRAIGYELVVDRGDPPVSCVTVAGNTGSDG